ncbi:acetylxylan esterase [Paraflavisolibacter sp. H34]|uniref:alpha/beta hydrolase family protein n=1 Tax=Huijunlia imazamoxiresistens TaxID=3127457 RepID=UPI003017A5BD
MKKSLLVLLTFFGLSSFAQTSDDGFKRPLKEVLQEIENRYKVKLKYSEPMVKDHWVTYAGWRFRPSVEKTLENILPTQDMTFSKTGTHSYELQGYRYHLKTPEEGKEQLDYLSTRYHDKESWEKRRAALRSCILSTLRLSPLPAKPASQPIVTPVRTMDGYTVQNVAIETLPGLYVSGSLYKPLKPKGKMPIILNPDGHFGDGRYRADCQYRCAMQARMGAAAFSYDLFAWGESALQFKAEDHRRSLAQTIQVLNGIRILDYLTTLKGVDTSRIAVTGGSGGGSQTMFLTAIDDRIKVSVPVVMLSAFHNGGCPCESGMGIQLCEGGSNNTEIAALAAPRPMLAVSDGKDMTQTVPKYEYPFLQRIYGFYGKTDGVQNVHLPAEGHDYGLSKRLATYDFLAQHLKLNAAAVKNKEGKYDESKVTIEKYPALYVFGDKGERLPANALKSFDELTKVFNESISQ